MIKANNEKTMGVEGKDDQPKDNWFPCRSKFINKMYMLSEREENFPEIQEELEIKMKVHNTF